MRSSTLEVMPVARSALRGADGPNLRPPNALAARLPALKAVHLAQEDRRRLRSRISGSGTWDAAGGGPDASPRDGSVGTDAAAPTTVDASVSPGAMDAEGIFSCSCDARGKGRQSASGAWSLGPVVAFLAARRRR